MDIVFLNAIVSRLITLKAMKNEEVLKIYSLKSHQVSATDPKMQSRLLRNRFFPFKTQSFSTTGH